MKVVTPYQDSSDRELLDLLKENNQQAFAELYDRYKVVLHRYAFKWLQDRDAAKDIIQDIFTIVWIKRESITLEKNLSGYLYIAVRNAILRKIERQDRDNQYAESLKSFASQEISNTDYLAREKQLKDIIEQEIAALPPKMREVFELSRNEYLSHAQIAERMGISELTVRTHVKNALKILRGKLGIYLFLYLLMR
ncbi:RNA polymerase sigma-70 factor [Pedobacter jeongneungensis]|uniref:RNA polymerase sigma-70 factor n=1 Tax=Pedobacter jeongneungensis TaxID=947309 RepID=UPI0004693653|nr:RNA polymerase sigma-70 factor [Pedobacter jeongneungensis]